MGGFFPISKELMQKVPRVPGFPVGTSESQAIGELGQPTKIKNRGFWPNTRTATYELLPNQITLGYIYYDRDRIYIGLWD